LGHRLQGLVGGVGGGTGSLVPVTVIGGKIERTAEGEIEEREVGLEAYPTPVGSANSAKVGSEAYSALAGSEAYPTPAGSAASSPPLDSGITTAIASPSSSAVIISNYSVLNFLTGSQQ